jgi:hypothetical protein
MAVVKGLYLDDKFSFLGVYKRLNDVTTSFCPFGCPNACLSYQLSTNKKSALLQNDGDDRIGAVTLLDGTVLRGPTTTSVLLDSKTVTIPEH